MVQEVKTKRMLWTLRLSKFIDFNIETNIIMMFAHRIAQ